MKTLLLDTCVVSALFDPGHRNHPKVQEFIHSLDPQGDHLYVCPIAIAEIKFGYEVCFRHDEARKRELLTRLRRLPVRPITKHTTAYYSLVRCALFNKFGTPVHKRGVKTIREHHPEDLIDRSTAKSLGIDENDLWPVACALEHNMTFVTADKMRRLKEIVQTELKLPIGWLVWTN